MSLGRTGRIGTLLVLAAALATSSSASAAIRHASPGAAGPEPCDSAAPCSLFAAVTGAVNGDEVIVGPGEYKDTAGDLGVPSVKQILLPVNVRVRGEAGEPRPRIVLEEAKWLGGALTVGPEDLVAHLEIATAASRSNISQFGGTIEDLIARNAAPGFGYACSLGTGTIRDPACLSSGAEGNAVGGNLVGNGTVIASLRNVTAIATGAGGVGLDYKLSDGGTVTVDAKSVLAQGDTKDIVAEGLSTSGNPGTGGHVTINLDHSVFGANEIFSEAGGSAAINPTNSFNFVPLLAADGYHQLKGSPTVDAGALDGASGTTDVDGQDRTIGAGPDVGADELGHQTSLALACDPLGVVLTDALPGAGSDCTATVTDLEEGVLPLTGSVAFSSSANGEFTASSCTLSAPGLSDHAACAVNYKPKIGSAGTHTVTAVFGGDGTHDGSQGAAAVEVTEAPFGPCPAGSSACPKPPVRPTVRIKRKPGKKTRKRRAKFVFASTDPAATFQCSLDGKSFKPCHSPFKRKVAPGRHVFAVRAVSGALSSKTANYGWRVLAPKR